MKMWIWSGEQRTDTGAAIFSSWSLVPRARQRTVSWKIASRARTARGRHTIACLAIGGWCGPNESGEKTWHARTRGTRKRGDGMRCSRCTKESLLHPSYRSAFGASCQPARPAVERRRRVHDQGRLFQNSTQSHSSVAFEMGNKWGTD